MRDDFTDISIIQDKSGSMGGLAAETISGYNSFLDEQRRTPGKCAITLTQFDTAFSTLYSGKDVKEVPPLTYDTYRPGGYTALLDAIALTINETGKRLSAMPEADRPGRVICVITTDGFENASKEHTREQVMAMIKEQSEKWKWQFIFLGANQDAIAAGHSIGVQSVNSVSTGATGQAVKEGYQAFSGNIRSYRMAPAGATNKLAFTKKQREEQRKEGANSDALNK